MDGTLWRLLVCTLWLTACGDNVFEGLDGSNPAEDAVKKLEEGDALEAERICLNALGSTYRSLYESIGPTTDLISMEETLGAEVDAIFSEDRVKNAGDIVSALSSAKAQMHGVDPFDVALVMATQDDSDESSNEVTAIFPALPEPTSNNILGLNVAKAVLNSLGVERFNKGDHYKSALFLTSSVSLASKALDSDGDGAISTLEANNLTDELAISILTNLASASLAIDQSTTTTDGEKARQNAEKISSLNSRIQSGEGSTSTDKLRSFLSNQAAN